MSVYMLQVKTWFQNRRMKHKKMNRKADGEEFEEDSDNEHTTSTNENIQHNPTNSNGQPEALLHHYTQQDADTEEIDVVSESD